MTNGFSTRRSRSLASRTLPDNHSDRLGGHQVLAHISETLLRDHAEVIAKAMVVLGSREAVVQWLTASAMGLSQQKPIDLLATPMGTQLVEELLDRIEHGIYA